jgi:hydroxylamine reductase
LLFHLVSLFSIPVRQAAMNHVDAFSLNEIATYGLKGLCAYAMHCHQLGVMDEDVMTNVHEIFRKLASEEPDMEGLLATVMKVGETNATVLKNLDEAHASTLGEPEPSPVRMTAVEGKCILVSGHDMADLYELLKQTEGKGINVYTHGEMMPAHAYPKLKAFPHLVGNYGTAWQSQKFEFAGFPGPIIVTTNCIIEPRRNYKDRIYTMNEVGVAGVQHLGDRDFSRVIAQALASTGFPRTIEPATYHTTGFNHRAVLPLAGKVLEAAKTGDLSRIFLIGGCDGSQWERSYFTDLAEKTPDDSLILTLGCAKNRVIHSEKLLNATLANGLPRVLDMGQCNDSYSAVVVATELAKALDCSINDLPLSLAISHLEQKAAAVLLTLLSMGVPAYITPNVLALLQKEYNLMGTADADDDLLAMMEGK